MNHTIKGILIVAAITSMLVVGATMIPIMQNSFASKKSDFKKPERDTNTNSNTNTNTNTNSATSDSDSTATASNTNNIDNSATATQNQTQSACAVAVTCPEGSTTVTLALPTPPVSTCNPSTIVGQMATPTDDPCTASSDDLSRTQQEVRQGMRKYTRQYSHRQCRNWLYVYIPINTININLSYPYRINTNPDSS